MGKPPENNAIQRRILVLLAAILCFLGVLVFSYIFNTLALKDDLVLVEDFYSIANDVLELRRYEKNILFRVGGDNYHRFRYYVDLLNSDLARIEEAAGRIAGADGVGRFRRDLLEYQNLIARGQEKNDFAEDEIRRLGKRLVDFTQGLVATKKAQIHKTLKFTMVFYLIVVCSAFVVVVGIFYHQVNSVLKRLKLLRRATRDVVRGSFVPLRDESGAKSDEISTLIQAFNKMVAEIDAQQEQLLQARKLAAIGTFSSGIAHELNNPLNNISLTADTLQEEYDDLSREEAMELIGDIISQTERASEVVGNLLEFSRKSDTGETVLNIKEVLEKTAKLVRNQMRIQSVWLEDYVPDDLPGIKGDFQKLQQVFLNLFLNSLHVMPEGGLIHLEGRVEPEGYVCIEVNDTGCGIEADKLERIFDPFYTTKPVGQGTGLGLSLVYGIIKKMGGYIEVRSKVNVGTTFAVHIPVADGGEEAA